jgi:hypothetical protein
VANAVTGWGRRDGRVAPKFWSEGNNMLKRTMTAVVLTGLMALPLAGCQTTGGASFGDAIAGMWRTITGESDKQTATRADAEKKYGPVTTDRLEVESFGLTPPSAAQGVAVEALVQYTVLLAAATGDIKVSETYTLVKGQDTIQLSNREVVRQQGTHHSSLKFTLPRDLAKGEYTLVTTISDGKTTKTAHAALRVI